MDTLIGAEIADRWDDGNGSYYAAAIMNRAKTVEVYSALIAANERLIANLLNISAEEKAQLEGVSHYNQAAELAAANAVFASVLVIAGGKTASAKYDAAELRLQSRELARAIKISITVKGDSDGRLRAAFSSVLSDAGFPRADSADASRYAINAEYSAASTQLAGTNKFTRYTLDAALQDTKSAAVLLPFNATGREGHVSQAEADERALRAAESDIKTKFKAALEKYIGL
jgi:hypothetical protein